jgi:hypothetical protein
MPTLIIRVDFKVANGLYDHGVALNKSSRLDFMEGYTEDDLKDLSKDGRSEI